MSGYVYVALNPAFSNLVKIGWTDRHPHQRARELYVTGTPYPFVMAYWIVVANPRAVETALHRRFDDRRANEGREYFEIPVVEAIDALKEHEETATTRLGTRSGKTAEAYVYMASTRHPAGLCRLGASTRPHAALLQELDSIYADVLAGGHIYFAQLSWHRTSSLRVAEACLQQISRLGRPAEIVGLRRSVDAAAFDAACSQALAALEPAAAATSRQERIEQGLDRLGQLNT